MEGGRGDREIERGLGQVGGLEIGGDHAGAREVGPQVRGERRAGLDGDDVGAAGEELAGGLAGAGPDLDDPRAGTEATPLRQQVVDALGVRRSGQPVLVGPRVERQSPTGHGSVIQRGGTWSVSQTPLAAR
jgi:hypothetical protein